MKHPRHPLLVLLLTGVSLVAFSNQPRAAGDVCATPDGFSLQAVGSGMGGTGITGKGSGGTGITGKGSGGTGIHTAEKGFGGTGITGKGSGGTGVQFAEKGTGGTGIHLNGRIGVYGRITGFGSICVNGLEIHYSSTTPVEISGERANADELQAGQIVAVTASLHGDRLVARDIAVDHLLAGRVDSVNPRSDSMVVDGRHVTISNADAIARSFNPGDYVNISGFKDAQGNIVASHVEHSNGAEKDVHNPAHFTGVDHVALQGHITAIEPHGDTANVTIGNNRVEEVNATGLSVNDRVIIFADVTSGGHLRGELVEEEHESIKTTVDTSEDKGGSHKSTNEGAGNGPKGIGHHRDDDRDTNRHGGKDRDDDEHSDHGSNSSHNDDEDDDDHSGHGGGDHEDNDDNSGPGGGDDNSGSGSETPDSDNSGPGGGSDDVPDSDNSGPGGGSDDVPDTDNSGPGGGGGNDTPDLPDTDNSGPGGGGGSDDIPDLDDHGGGGGGGSGGGGPGPG